MNNDIMLDISNVTSIVGPRVLVEEKTEEIIEKCMNEKEKLSDLEQAKVAQKDPKNITLVIKGRTNIDNTSTCTMNFDIRNNFTTTSAVFSTE